MRGDQGKLKEIVALKEKYNFRLFVDDAHGIGTLGAKGWYRTRTALSRRNRYLFWDFR